VSNPQCLVNSYCPGLPPGVFGVKDVLLLAGQSVLTKDEGRLVGRENAPSLELVVLDRWVLVGELSTY
jgi:hypothetical protein